MSNKQLTPMDFCLCAQAIFLRMLTKQKLPLYERFSELRRKVEFNSTLRGSYLRSANQMD